MSKFSITVEAESLKKNGEEVLGVQYVDFDIDEIKIQVLGQPLEILQHSNARFVDGEIIFDCGEDKYILK